MISWGGGGTTVAICTKILNAKQGPPWTQPDGTKSVLTPISFGALRTQRGLRWCQTPYRECHCNSQVVLFSKDDPTRPLFRKPPV